MYEEIYQIVSTCVHGPYVSDIIWKVNLTIDISKARISIVRWLRTSKPVIWFLINTTTNQNVKKENESKRKEIAMKLAHDNDTK